MNIIVAIINLLMKRGHSLGASLAIVTMGEIILGGALFAAISYLTRHP